MPESANKSLHELSVDNGRFQATPLFWTNEHLELVGCQFLEIEVANDSQGQHARQDGRLTYYATRLATTPVENMKAHYIRSLFRGTGVLEFVLYVTYTSTASLLLTFRSASAAFYYAGRLVHVPEVSAFRIAGHIDVPHPEPVVGYYSYKADEIRRARFTPRAGPPGTLNLAMQSLYQRKLARVTPEDWTRDPYLVCILLSLAQLQARSDNTGQPRLYIVS